MSTRTFDIGGHTEPRQGLLLLLEGHRASVRLTSREGVPRAPGYATFNVNGKYPAREHYIESLVVKKRPVGHPDAINGR